MHILVCRSNAQSLKNIWIYASSLQKRFILDLVWGEPCTQEVSH